MSRRRTAYKLPLDDSRVPDDAREEVAFHLREKVRRLVSQGMSEEDAWLKARRRFGNVEEVEGMMRREQRLRLRAQWWNDVRQDVAYALRMLGRTRGFTAGAALTLALSIGAATAIFTVVDGVLLRPLPYPNADRTLLLWTTGKSGTQAEGEDYPFSVANFVDLREETRTLQVVAAFRAWRYALLDENGEAEQLAGSRVSPGLFAALGVEPALGRAFVREDETAGAEAVVILSDALWRRRFGADPGVLGTRLSLNGAGHVVVGVMPASFTFPRGAELPPGLAFGSRTEIWAPLTVSEDDLPVGRGTLNVAVLGLPGMGESAATVNGDLTRIMGRLEEQYPRFNTGLTARTSSMLDVAVSSVRRPLYVLLGAVGFLLLIACVNVSNLLLTRSASRRREWSVRGALGAGRERLLRQVITETVVLTALGGALGVVLAAGATDGLHAMLPPGLPRLDDVSLDWRVLGVVSSVVLVAGAGLGWLAAAGVGSNGLSDELRSGTRELSGRFGLSMRKATLVLEVAASLVLLVGAYALGRTFYNLSHVDAGVAPEGVLTAEVSLPRTSVDAADFGAQLPVLSAFYTALAERLADQPGVVRAGVVSALPLSGLWESAGIRIEGQPPPEPGRAPSILFAAASDGYFAAVGMRLLRGRAFGPADASRETAGMIITESMAERLWPRGDALGARVSAFFGREIEIVGIVTDVRHRGVDSEPEPMMFLPLSLYAGPSMHLVVVTAGNPEAALPTLRSTLRSLDAGVPLTNVRTLRQVFDASLGEQRFSATLLALFAAAALALVVIGLHGVIAYGVARRSREFGLRLALGAEPTSVLRSVVAEGLKLAVVGVAIGLAGALALGRVLSGLVFEVSATDPLTLGAVSGLLLAVSLGASLLPALRALRLDPARTLAE
jgi:predicted permease